MAPSLIYKVSFPFVKIYKLAYVKISKRETAKITLMPLASILVGE